MVTFRALCRRDRGLTSGTAPAGQLQQARRETGGLAERQPEEDLEGGRQAWIAASLLACWRSRLPYGMASHCIEGSNRTVSDPRCLKARL